MLAANEINPPQQPPDDHKINWIWIVGYVLFYIIVSVLYGSFGSWWNIIFFPMVFLTTAVVYGFYNKYVVKANASNDIRFSDLFRAYSHSFFGGGILALIAELWITTVVVYGIMLMFGSSRALEAVQNESYAETAMSYTCSNAWIHVYLFFSSFCVAGLVEEFVKAYVLQYVCKLYLPYTTYLQPTQTHFRQIVWLGFCIGLGFGTMEGVLYVCVYGGAGGPFGQLLLWVVRAFVAIPFHSITGSLWGVQLARRECQKQRSLNWFAMGYQQVLLHGLYDFIEMELAFDLVCAESANLLQSLLTLGIAVVYTVVAGIYANWRYKRLLQSAANDQRLIQ